MRFYCSQAKPEATTYDLLEYYFSMQCGGVGELE